MDRVLLAVVALGLGFLLWQLHGEIKDLKYAMMVEKTAIVPAPAPSPIVLEQKPCVVNILPIPMAKKPAPLQLRPSIQR